MDDRFNTIAGWTLASGIVALGLASISGHYFRANKDQRPEKMGYEIAGVVKSGGAVAAVPIETLLAKADPVAGADTFKKCLFIVMPGLNRRDYFAFNNQTLSRIQSR